MEFVLMLPLIFILLCMLFGFIIPKPYSDSLREDLRRAEERSDRLHREIDEYISSLEQRERDTRVEVEVEIREIEKKEEEEKETLADVRRRAFPPPDPATANPEMEPYCPPSPTWDGFTREYPPPPPPRGE